MTCLCLTKNRRQWLPQAIQCFQQQTYPNRELLIVADGEDVRDLVPDDSRIRFIQIEAGFQIGAKRNFGVRKATGEIIAHWDDDDYSAPARLADQIDRLLESGKRVTGYHSMRFTDGSRWWLYNGIRDYALGTSLCYWKDWAVAHPFPDLQIGEDNAFGSTARQAGQFIAVEAGELMHASIHAGNTSPKNGSQGNEWVAL